MPPSEAHSIPSSSLPSFKDVAKLSALESVVSVFPNKLVPRPEPVSGVNAVGDVGAENPTDTFSPHQMTGVDKLHNMGIYGSGVKVAVIDTGTDYTNPALGSGCFGTGCKVAKGYDFVGDAFTGSGALVPDNDPMDCAGHGTHVSGIIGADFNALNFTGVAPQATLYAYRVFGCEGSTQSSIIIEAMLRAYQDGADILSISIGGAAAFTADGEAVVATRLSEAGVVVSVSAGNSGDSGLFYTSSPAIGTGVIAVSSIDNTVTPALAAILSNGDGPFFLTGSPAIVAAGQFEIFVSSPDTSVTDDACSPYPAGTDLTGKVALVKRGTCPFADKAQNVLNAGAEIMLIYNNVAGATVSADIGGVDIQQAVITNSDGLAIAAAVAADPTVTISFPDRYYNSPNTATGGLVSDFTSYGLTADAFIKPQIGAPGGNILSTYPVAKGSYAVLSGTSMAAPFISGVVALFIGQNGKMDPEAIRNILQNTAVPVATSIGGSQLNTVAQQGAGLVDAYAAVVGFKAVVTPSEIALNDTLNGLKTSTITISNVGTSSTSYRLTNLPAAAALTFGANGNQVNRDVPLVEGDASVVFSSTFVTIAAGASADVVATFTAPTGLDPNNVPIYSGFVLVESADLSERYTIPYAGIAASLKNDYPILDTSDDLFSVPLPAIVDGNGDFILAPQTLTFANGDDLSIVYNALGSSPSLLIDLVPSDTNFAPSITKRHFQANKMHKILRRADPVPTVILGNLSSEQYAYRNDPEDADNSYNFFSISNAQQGFYFSDGTKVPNGDYKVLFRAQKIASDLEFESWLSPVITVNQA
ncbi:peptidase S8/S53 domain-containing protein [Mrakia frigida]|uniref:peptidase S8/S53 domain-containing protein n=1 Tax=Mrakia frigida TaxID=29902 RepID=UPI003FCBF5F7